MKKVRSRSEIEDAIVNLHTLAEGMTKDQKMLVSVMIAALYWACGDDDTIVDEILAGKV